ncbi:MAG TPA: hypothetical protein ENI23_03865 [bacterium]|nr:hypothetical protein [bacterium]
MEKKPEYIKPDVLTPAVVDTPPAPDPYQGDLTDEELLADQKKIESKLSKEFPQEFLAILKRLSYYLSLIGLDFNEACQMIRFDPKDMEEKIREHPIIQDLIDIKILEYKVSLIKSVSKQAITGDHKLAQWLLERRFPNEFNPKKGIGILPTDPDRELAGVIEFIQRSSDSTPLIKETAGRAYLFKKNSQENIPTAVKDILV